MSFPFLQLRDVLVRDQRRDLDELPVAGQLAGLDEARRVFLCEPLHDHDDRRVRIRLTALHGRQQFAVRLVSVRLAVRVLDLQWVVDDDRALPPFGHVASTEAGDLATEGYRVHAPGLLPIDEYVPALLRLRVVSDDKRPKRLVFAGCDDVARRLAVQQRKVVRVRNVQEPGARVQRETACDQIDRNELGLRRARRHVDDYILQLAVDHTLHRVGDEHVVPVDAELDRLPMLEEVPAEEQVIALAFRL